LVALVTAYRKLYAEFTLLTCLKKKVEENTKLNIECLKTMNKRNDGLELEISLLN